MYIISWNSEGTKEGASWVTLVSVLMQFRDMKYKDRLGLLQESGRPPWRNPESVLPANGMSIPNDDPYWEVLEHTFPQNGRSYPRIQGTWVPFLGAKMGDPRCSEGSIYVSYQKYPCSFNPIDLLPAGFRKPVEYRIGHAQGDDADGKVFIVVQVHLVSGAPALADSHLTAIQNHYCSSTIPVVIVGDMNIDCGKEKLTVISPFQVCAPKKYTREKSRKKLDFALYTGMELDVVFQQSGCDFNSDHDPLVYETTLPWEEED